MTLKTEKLTEPRILYDYKNARSSCLVEHRNNNNTGNLKLVINICLVTYL